MVAKTMTKRGATKKKGLYGGKKSPIKKSPSGKTGVRKKAGVRKTGVARKARIPKVKGHSEVTT